MKNYKVNVNGTEYKVSIELINESDIPQQANAATPVSAPAKTETPVQQSAAPAPAANVQTAPAGGEKINAPMPGNILAVNVNVGDTVKKGQVLAILEAMKMENEIMSPVDGKVTFVGVSKGSTVETDASLFVIE